MTTEAERRQMLELAELMQDVAVDERTDILALEHSQERLGEQRQQYPGAPIEFIEHGEEFEITVTFRRGPQDE